MQFPWYSTEAWRGAFLTEIAMLRWAGGERQHVTARLSELRCGPADALRGCRADEPAVAQMAGACSGAVPEAIQTLRRRSSCRDEDPMNEEHVDINGEEYR